MHKHLSNITLLLAISCLAGSSLAQTHASAHPLTSAPSLQWTWGNPTPSGDAFNVVAYGNGIYVAAGQDGALYSSNDGINWSSQSSVIGNGGQYLDAIYGGGNFLVTGVDAGGATHIAVSSDGVNWTDTQIGLTQTGSISLAYGGSSYLAVGSHSVATSTDGVHWIIKSAPVVASPNSTVEYANSVFVVDNNGIYYSTDGGATWTLSSGPNGAFGGLASNGSAFFIFDASDGFSYTSTNGNHWTKIAALVTPPLFGFPVLWDGARFLTFSPTSTARTPIYAYTSTDGVTWTKGTSVSAPPILDDFQFTEFLPHGIVSTGSGYISVVPDFPAVTILQSTDFVTWTTAFAANGPTIDFTDMIYAGGRYIAVGGPLTDGAGIMESTDGLTWNSVYTGAGTLGTVVYGNGVYVAAGSDQGTDTLWLTSTDGVSWNTVTNPPLPFLGRLDYDNTSQLAFGNGIFVGIAESCTKVTCTNTSVTSKDGKSWVTHPLPTAFLAAGVNAIGYTGVRFVALGGTNYNPDSDSNPNSTALVFTSCDGITWANSSTFNAPPDMDFYKLARLSNGSMAALGIFTPPCFASSCGSDDSTPVVAISTDGSSWSAAQASLPQGLDEQAFSDIAFDGETYYATGSVYAFGDGGTSIVTSTDAVHWGLLSNVPLAAQIATLAINGNQIVAGGGNGALISATLPRTLAALPPSSGTCKDLPAVPPPPPPVSSGKSGGGEFGLLTLVALLGFSGLRWRRHGRPD